MSSATMCSSCIRAARSLSKRSGASYLRQSSSRLLGTSSAAAKRIPSRSSNAASTPLRSFKPAFAPTPPASRFFSSSPRILATKVIQNPRQDENGNDMTIEITPRAAQRLKSIMDADHNPRAALRVTVESGGCHGFQYTMVLSDGSDISAEEDTVFEGEHGARVVMDESSLDLLKGSKVDYTMELIGSQFKIVDNPYATSSCGCGTSFDIKVPEMGAKI